MTCEKQKKIATKIAEKVKDKRENIIKDRLHKQKWVRKTREMIVDNNNSWSDQSVHCLSFSDSVEFDCARIVFMQPALNASQRYILFAPYSLRALSVPHCIMHIIPVVEGCRTGWDCARTSRRTAGRVRGPGAGCPAWCSADHSRSELVRWQSTGRPACPYWTCRQTRRPWLQS